MTTYLYCLLTPARPDAIPPGLQGIAGAEVRALTYGAHRSEIELWVSSIDPAQLKLPPAATAQNALVHHAVVSAALATGRTPLPARFGQRFPDDDACLADAGARAPALRAALARVAGLVEMTVLLAPSTHRMLRELQPVVPEAIRPNEANAGRRYLEALRASERDAQKREAFVTAIVERLTAAVASYVRAEHRTQSNRTVVATLAHLVPRSEAETYRAAIQRVEAPSGFQVLVAGPRAPYSFCDDRDGTNGGIVLAS